MKYKIIAIDVDGTLVDDNGDMPLENIEALRNAYDKGVIVTLCTGRPIQAAQPIMDSIGLDMPFITYNGAMVVSAKTHDILFEQSMSLEDVLRVYKLGKEYDTTMIVWSRNRLYVNRMDERSISYGKQAQTEPELVTDINKLAIEGVTKILWYDEVDIINGFVKTVGNHVGEGVNFHTSKPFFLEFVDVKSSKGLALEKLGEHLGVERDSIIAIGDGYNDLSMIEYAGMGIAMENAPDDIKEKADFVTLSNNENGVAYAVNKFI